LVRKMAEAYPQFEHLVLRGIEDWESIQAILTSLQNLGNVQAVSADEVAETVSLIKGAKLLVSNDTGIRHIGIVCDTPTVGLFFSTEVFRYWPRFGNHDVVFNGDGSVPEFENVFAAAKSVLKNTKPPWTEV
jgi:ADP-heptose:LPS heptosyltransferase